MKNPLKIFDKTNNPVMDLIAGLVKFESRQHANRVWFALSQITQEEMETYVATYTSSPESITDMVKEIAEYYRPSIPKTAIMRADAKLVDPLIAEKLEMFEIIDENGIVIYTRMSDGKVFTKSEVETMWRNKAFL